MDRGSRSGVVYANGAIERAGYEEIGSRYSKPIGSHTGDKGSIDHGTRGGVVFANGLGTGVCDIEVIS